MTHIVTQALELEVHRKAAAHHNQRGRIVTQRGEGRIGRIVTHIVTQALELKVHRKQQGHYWGRRNLEHMQGGGRQGLMCAGATANFVPAGARKQKGGGHTQRAGWHSKMRKMRPEAAEARIVKQRGGERIGRIVTDRKQGGGGIAWCVGGGCRCVHGAGRALASCGHETNNQSYFARWLAGLGYEREKLVALTCKITINRRVAVMFPIQPKTYLAQTPD